MKIALIDYFHFISVRCRFPGFEFWKALLKFVQTSKENLFRFFEIVRPHLKAVQEIIKNSDPVYSSISKLISC
jgi:hypothetical protein